MVSDKWVEEALYKLANIAWAARRIVPTREFVLRPDSLPDPTGLEKMASVVQHYYSHARKWAPGFEVPFSVPRVRVSAFVESAGQYRIDSDGFLHIEIAPEFRSRPEAVLVILAHEACHHILDLSGVRGASTEENELLTDLAMFICGLGDIVMNGFSVIRSADSGRISIHLGYLTSDQYRLANNWVLQVQALLPSGRPNLEKPLRPASPKPAGIIARIMGWLKGFSRVGKPVQAERFARSRPSGESRMSFSIPLTAARQTALARLGGNKARLERLIQYEKGRQPDADELTLLDAVLERLEQDRR